VLFEFNMIFIFLVLGYGFVLIALLLGSLIRPRRIVQKRTETYECGETPTGSGWYNFNPRFYLLALIFLIFDVEIVVTFPVIVVLRRWASAGAGGMAFVEILIFVLILVTGLIFLWGRGDLEWIKKLESSDVQEEPL